MLQTVSIHNGQLSIGRLLFQLYDENGEPASVNYYRGEACIQGNQLRIILGRSTIYDYTVATNPTPESVDYQSGYEKGKSQKRRRLPKQYSDHWYSGWLTAWQEKG